MNASKLYRYQHFQTSRSNLWEVVGGDGRVLGVMDLRGKDNSKPAALAQAREWRPSADVTVRPVKWIR